MNAIKIKSHDLGTGVLVGLVVGGLVSSVLSIANVTYSGPIGGFIGGALAAYIMYTKIAQASLAGALAGILSLPFFLGVSQILVIFEVIPLPPGPQPSFAELQSAVVAISLMNLLAGGVGGSILGMVRHPPMVPPTTQQTIPGVPGQTKYCVQCGAQFPSGTVLCPHCGARQPQ
jgi:hypothetical protein